jgi:hypothetical protein
MSTPLFLPHPKVVAKIDASAAIPLRELIIATGAQCRASGTWTLRPILLKRGTPGINKEPGDWTPVEIYVDPELTELEAYRVAACLLAYSVLDTVARESIRGLEWTRPTLPRGRPYTGTAKTGAMRQSEFRKRKALNL